MREGAVSWAAFGVSACGEAELMANCEGILHQREMDVFRSDRLGRWRFSYLRGRLCAKAALGMLVDPLKLSDVAIERGVFGQPVVRSRHRCNAQVSISHSGNWAAALAFDEGHPMGADIEAYSDSKQDVIRSNMTAAELDAIAATSLNSAMQLTVLWTIKESLSKVLRSGLMSPWEIYAIESVRDQGDVVVSTFRNFAQYKCLSFSIAEHGLSITLPKRTHVDLDVGGLLAIFRSDSPRPPEHLAPS